MILKNLNCFKRDDCVPKSKIDKLIRFHEPPPFWGPGKRPKSNGDGKSNDKNKVNILNCVKKEEKTNVIY